MLSMFDVKTEWKRERECNYKCPQKVKITFSTATKKCSLFTSPLIGSVEQDVIDIVRKYVSWNIIIAYTHVTKLLISLKQGRVNCATFLFGRDTCSVSDMTLCFLSSASQRMQRLQLKAFTDLMYCTSNNALKATYPSSPTV